MAETQKAPDSYILTRGQLMVLLKEAATEGLRIGKEGTEGDHTATGIAAEVLYTKPISGYVMVTK